VLQVLCLIFFLGVDHFALPYLSSVPDRSGARFQ
jgi:hypothetical protein